MDLSLSPQDEAFRDEVRAFLDAKLTPDLREADRRAGGVFADFAAGHRWYKALAEKGWIAPNWPTEYGGAGWNAVQRYIFHEECARANAPRFFNMAVRMVGPVIIRFGTEEQKAKYLPRILSGEDVWCQGYSEPGSGSDLASLKTRAVREGDHYVINGTKIWTTFAHHANRMFCLVRTSGEGKAQDGISFVLIDDIRAPGITIKPIITLAGDHEVNQVFFDNVKVPVANRIGDENAGWTVAKYLLEFERGGDPYSASLIKAIEGLRHMAAQEHSSHGSRLAEDPYFQQRIAEAEIDVMALEYAEKRIMAALSNGQNPGAASSMMKIRGSETLQKLTEIAIEAIGYYAQPFEPEARAPGRNIDPVVPEYAVTTTPQYFNHRAASIYAGSNEIQRNILAKAMLGL
jgi:alkylation response protein AidB-like acyl-CoA dehydrogenase